MARVLVHVEIEQKSCSSLAKSTLIPIVDDYLSTLQVSLSTSLSKDNFDDHESLRANVDHLRVEVDPRCVERVTGELLLQDQRRVQRVHHVYRLHTQEGEEEELDVDGDDNPVVSCLQWSLPNACFEGLWESLVYETRIKNELLLYGQTALKLSSMNVDSNMISWNKLILLHGPPGSGKTSLCQALAHKLTIRQGFQRGLLVEINAHSLFSKWFSESGKLVQRMFASILDLIEDPNSFVVLLIDEIESLASARRNASSNEPSDAIRVVNALLTQLDTLKRHPNVLVLATSNLSEAIDEAFVDRADLSRFIGHPTGQAIVTIIEQSCQELVSKGLIVLSQEGNEIRENGKSDENEDNLHSTATSYFSQPATQARLNNLALKCEGFSGRSLRRLPFLALTKVNNVELIVDFETFIACMEKAADISKTGA